MSCVGILFVRGVWCYSLSLTKPLVSRRLQYIESVYKQNKFVANVFVYGESKQEYLVAIVVPNFEALAQWADAHGLKDIANVRSYSFVTRVRLYR